MKTAIKPNIFEIEAYQELQHKINAEILRHQIRLTELRYMRKEVKNHLTLLKLTVKKNGTRKS